MQSVKRTLSNLQKQGLDLFSNKWGKKFEGKSVEQIAKNSKSFENFNKAATRTKEQPKIVKEVVKYKEKLKSKLTISKPNIKDIITDKSKAIIKFNHGFEPNQSNLQNKTYEESKQFLETYFKSIRSDYKVQNMIEEISDRFGSRIDLFHDFVDNVLSQDFKYEHDNQLYEAEMFKSSFPDEYHQSLSNRLEQFSNILKNNYKL